MTEKNTKTRKSTKIKKDTDKVVDQNLETRQTFKFEWDTVFRILGSITGIAGVSTVLLVLFGYLQYLGASTATDIPIQLYFTNPKELILLEGTASFVAFILNVAILLLIYTFSRLAVRLLIKSIFNRINRRPTIFGVGILLFLIAGVISVWGIKSYEFDITSTKGILILAAHLFPAFEIFHGVDEEYVKLGEHSQERKIIYNKSLFYFFGVIKNLVLIGWIVFILIIQSVNAVNSGQATSCNDLIKSPTSVVLFSNHPMGLEGETTNEEVYAYEGYYLLFFDKDTYYLYREIEPQTLKPTSVYFINSGNFNAIEVQSVKAPTDWNFTRSCLDTLIK